MKTEDGEKKIKVIRGIETLDEVEIAGGLDSDEFSDSSDYKTEGIMKLAIEIAKTHLLSKPKQTLVAMLGVTFGIGMFIGMVSLMTGLNNFTEELTMTSSPDIHIYNDITQDRPTILERSEPERF